MHIVDKRYTKETYQSDSNNDLDLPSSSRSLLESLLYVSFVYLLSTMCIVFDISSCSAVTGFTRLKRDIQKRHTNATTNNDLDPPSSSSDGGALVYI